MQFTEADLRWLRYFNADGATALPPFNKSRLITLCLLDVVGGRLVLTARANAILKRGTYPRAPANPRFDAGPRRESI